MKFGAIDIGSNAVRLLLKNVYKRNGESVFVKDSLYRVPVRLGEEAFSDGQFSESKMEDLCRTMEAFKALLEVHRATAYRAVATSAMRDADNGQELADKVKERTGIKIEIISGREEANVILRSEFGQHRQDNDQDYLYIDVGGGSTELVFFKSGKASASRSFRIGTLRVLNSQVGKGTWEDMRSWLNDHKPDSPEIIGIGSGGNINKMIKLYGKARQIYLDRETVEAAHEHLSNLSYGERVQDLGLKPDRADVIEPASQIFKRIMTWAGVEKLIVPKFGLADGIIRELYLEKNLK